NYGDRHGHKLGHPTAPGYAQQLAQEAARVVAGEAVAAPAAGDEGFDGDGGARFGLGALAGQVDGAADLMAGEEAGGRRERAPEEVEVGPADPGGGDGEADP